MQNQTTVPGADTGPKVRVLHNGAELWRGSIRQFYRNNDMDSEAARDIHAQLRRYGNANVGGGAAGDFTLSPSSEEIR